MNWQRVLVASLLAIGVLLFSFVLARFIPTLENLEYTTLDWRFRWRGAQPVSDSPVVLVTIDDESFGAVPERWPWPRSLYARAVENLTRAGAAVIGIDVILDVPDYRHPENDAQLVRAIQQSGKVVLARKLEQDPRLKNYQYLVEPYDSLKAAAAGRLGLVSIESDPDGIYRRYPAVQAYQNQLLTSFALELIRMYRNYSPDLPVEYTGEALVFGEYVIPNYDAASLLIDFAGPRGSFPQYSFYSVIDDARTNLGEEYDLDYFTESLLPDRVFENKIVLIGSTVSELHDNFPTPFLGYGDTSHETPGVEILANATQTILSHSFYRKVPGSITLALVILLGAFIILASLRLSAGGAALVILSVLMGYFLAAFYLFVAQKWVLDMMFPLLTLFLMFVSTNLYNYYQEQKEKKRIMGAFQHYVPVKVIQELMEHPEKLTLGGEERVMTVLFSDVANFTTISESLSPRELVRLINEYLSEMTDIILKHDGIIDKYEGDAIMAEFGAPIYYPQHALKACWAALEMQERLKELSRAWRRAGRPVLSCRAGINTGNMIVGNMGSQKVFDYTVLGDEVNLASRLEGANKPFGTKIMISEATYQEVKDGVITRPLARLVVKGKTKPVQVYELIGKKGDKIPNLLESILPLYENGFQFYLQQEWEQAASCFRKCLRLMPDDGPSRLYLRYVTEYRENPPPPDWDGVYEMRSK